MPENVPSEARPHLKFVQMSLESAAVNVGSARSSWHRRVRKRALTDGGRFWAAISFAAGFEYIGAQQPTESSFWTTMKKISACILIAAIGVGSAALLAWPRAAAADPPAASPTPTTAETSLSQQILSKEREELDAQKAGNFKAFENLIADEGVFVNADGPASKAEMLKRTEGIKLLEYGINGVKFLPISADTGLIS